MLTKQVTFDQQITEEGIINVRITTTIQNLLQYIKRRIEEKVVEPINVIEKIK